MHPDHYSMALPLFFNFFAVFGLRASLAIPTDIDANWPFRMRPPTVLQSINASRLLIVLLGVSPIALVWLLLTLSVWPIEAALGSTLITLLAGLLLTEIALANWTKVPFATAHAPTGDACKSRWPAALVALYVYTYILAEIEVAAVQTTQGTLVCSALLATAVAVLRVWRMRTLRRRPLTLDAPTAGAETLNLSEAIS